MQLQVWEKTQGLGESVEKGENKLHQWNQKVTLHGVYM